MFGLKRQTLEQLVFKLFGGGGGGGGVCVCVCVGGGTFTRFWGLQPPPYIGNVVVHVRP